MDPKATLDFIRDLDNRPRERAEALQDLAAWIARGGFVPDTGGEYVPDSYDDAPYEIEEGDSAALVSAVNVVLANGDLSGLEGLGFTVIR